MGYWEANGASNDWYTPEHIFDALGVMFDMDVAAPENGVGTFVPAREFIHRASLSASWRGLVWMNPPFGGRNGLKPWLDRFIEHGNGIALTPDRTSAPWWQEAAPRMDAVLFVSGKLKFHRPDGSTGDSPSNGTTLFGLGSRAIEAIERAQQRGLGYLARRRMTA